MKACRFCLLIGAASPFVFLSSNIFAQPVLNPANGHYYEVVSASGITWAGANTAANASSAPIDPGNPTSESVPGHLVTIDSPQELAFVESLRAAAVLSKPEVWIGAYQLDPAAAPGDSWVWVDGTPLPGVDSPVPNFADWQPGQPDDKGGPTGESFATLGHDYGKRGYEPGYNDLTSTTTIGGYIREFDVSNLADCQSSEGCKGPKGLKLVIPSSAKPIDDNFGVAVGFVTTEILDPRVQLNPDGTVPPYPVCDGSVLVPPQFGGALTVPGYLCGSPYIKIIHAIGSNLSIPYGTVFAEADQLDENGGESGPFRCALSAGSDPRRRHRLVFETTDTRPLDGLPDMFENLAGNVFYGNDGSIGPLPLPDGTYPSAGPFTAGCASSFGTLKSKSFFLIGMHLQCNSPDGISWDLTPLYVIDCFILLADNKARMLEQAVQRTYDAGVISRGDYRKLMTQATQARTKLTEGNAGEAVSHYQNFVNYATSNASYDTTIDDINHFGEHMMRVVNLLFILNTDILPNL